MIHWYTSEVEARQRLDQLRDAAASAHAFVHSVKEFQGWCAACRATRTFRLVGDPREWINLRESILCECGLSGRGRMIFAALAERSPRAPCLVFERVTPFFARLARVYPFVEGCEYFGHGVRPGSVQSFGGLTVRHEDMLALSFPDNSLEHLLHADVLEHVPDMRRALVECHRVLAPRGTMLFTCPLMNRQAHFVRAVVTDGQLRHFAPPCFHGNPVDAQGALVYTEPGWQLLGDVADAGFSRVEVGLAFDVAQGLLRDGNPYEEYNMWPLVFRATK